MHRFDIKTIQNVEIRRKTFKTTQTNESDQIIMHCIDLTSKRSKLLSYVAKLQNDQIIVHWIDLTSKRSKKLSYVPKLQKQSNYNGLHRFDIKSFQNVEIRRKTFKTTHTNESDQIIMHCIDMTSKRSKLLSYVAKLQKIKL